ncbi:hypothetical protein TWF506_002456 [Arthrobotrys conoides]|uniref:BTB domain-containing protein n=1 Tax=Arthrobotrys conoides TaxID=74498 RepID=A0AAN8RUU4_9PEZI
MGGGTAPSLADFLFDLPFASDLGVSGEEAEKYEEMRYSYYGHFETPDEDVCANSILQFLKGISDPPEPVSTFMTMLAEAGVLTDPALESPTVVDEPGLGQYQPDLHPQLEDLEELFSELESEKYRPKSLDEDLYVEYLRHDGFKLLSAPHYAAFPTDFTIRAGSGSQLCIFHVESQRVKKNSPFFSELLQSGKCGDPGQYSYSSDEHPVAMDWYLAYLYGVPFQLSLPDNKSGPHISFVRSLVNLAINVKCHGLVEDITQELGRSFTYYHWGLDIAPCVMDLYKYHHAHIKKDGNRGIKIAVSQLVDWIIALNADKKLSHLKHFIGENMQTELDLGSGNFLRDLSIALCKVLDSTTQVNSKYLESTSSSECDSTIVVEATEIPDGSNKPRLEQV